MTKVNFGGLKQKLLASIVAISAIQVLKAFMNIDVVFDAQKLAWRGRRASGVRGLGVYAGAVLIAGAAAIMEANRRGIEVSPHGEERGFARLEPWGDKLVPVAILRDATKTSLFRMRTPHFLSRCGILFAT